MKFMQAFVVAAAALVSQAVLAAEEVAVQFARVYQSDLSGSCEVCTFFTGVVEVKNIAYAKEVNVHYHSGFSGWAKKAAQYIGPSRPGYEYWGFQSSQLGSAIQFAVEYKVAGQTYWDNNGAADYYVQTEAPLFVNDEVKVLLSRDQRLEIRRFPEFIGVLATIHLQNLGYDKVVKVRYTTDAWQTWSEVSAGYGLTTSTGLERWGFSLELPLTAQNLEFAVAYTVNGETYWDSNVGRNYKFALPQ